MTATSPAGAFSGLKVVDLTQGLAGPFCAMTIAQHGAEVIKIEPPEGDWSRTIGGAFDDRTPSFVTCNRGKRAIVADLKSSAGRDVVFQLAARADVFMESNRAGVADRLGIGYDAIRALKPDIIYLSITGFGQSGPYRDRAVTDAIMQAFSGLMTRNRADDGLPRRIDFPVPDYTTGMMAYQTLATALYGRAMGQGGRHLDISLMQSLMAYQQATMMHFAVDGGPHAAPFPPTGTFAASDGLLNVSVIREKYFQALCKVLGVPELGADPRFATLAARRDNEAVLRSKLEALFATWKVDDLAAAMREADVPHGKVNSYLDAATDPHVEATGAVHWAQDPALGRVPLVNMPGAPVLAADDPRCAAPAKGQHTRDVLTELGLGPAAIDELLASGAVA